MRRSLLLLLTGLLVFAPVAVAAGGVERNETVYATLDNHGRPREVQVVTWLRGSTSQVAWVDYGHLQQVQNSVSDIAPTIGDGTISWPEAALQGEGLFYQGSTDQQLPIDLVIDYYLDGRSVEPVDLAGQSGRVTIKLHAQNNLRQEETIRYLDYYQRPQQRRAVLYTPLVVQVSQALPVGTWTGVEAAGATQVLVGNRLRLSWTLFPYPDAELTWQADGSQISLEPLEITVLPMMPPLPTLDIGSAIQQLVSGVDQLAASLQQLQGASAALASGQAEAAAGGEQLSVGWGQLAQAGQASAAGADALAGGLSQLQKINQQLVATAGRLQQSGDPELQALAVGLLTEQQALQQLLPISQQLATGLGQSNVGLSQIADQTTALLAGVKELSSGQQALAAGLLAVEQQGLSPLQSAAISQFDAAAAGAATTAAMQRLVQNHHSFSDNLHNQIGQVQYLFRTAGVAVPPAESPAVPPPEPKRTLWQRIVHFFTGK